MAALLDERMSAIVVEVEMAKQVCSDLDRRVQDLEQENRQLRSTVHFLSQQETERTQRTADILVGESATRIHLYGKIPLSELPATGRKLYGISYAAKRKSRRPNIMSYSLAYLRRWS